MVLAQPQATTQNKLTQAQQDLPNFLGNEVLKYLSNLVGEENMSLRFGEFYSGLGEGIRLEIFIGEHVILIDTPGIENLEMGIRIDFAFADEYRENPFSMDHFHNSRPANLGISFGKIIKAVMTGVLEDTTGFVMLVASRPELYHSYVKLAGRYFPDYYQELIGPDNGRIIIQGGLEA